MISVGQAVVFLFGFLATANSADILIISSVGSISHSRWYGKMAFMLAQNGHKVVVLDTDPNYFEHPNITHFIMEGAHGWMELMENQVKDNPNALDDMVESNSVLDNILLLSNPMSLDCDVLMKSETAKTFLFDIKGKKFDLVIADFFCECFYAIVSIVGNPPLIPASPYFDIIGSDSVGVFDNPSYVPFHMSNLRPQMNFFERLTNTVYYLMNYYFIKNYQLPLNDALAREVLGPSIPKLEDILRNNVALIMTGNSYVIQGSKPLPPNYIPLGGFHVDPPKPLPQDIKKFLDEAKEGAILFSMGSNFKSTLMSEEKREMFLSVFRNIPQRVIWKLELENATNIPPNVMIKKWLPQSDILGHPNIKAFISHGGLLGTQEAIHRGVPVLGLPIMADQITNLLRLQRAGAGIRLYYKHLNKKYIEEQVKTIINDPSYLENMKSLSAAFRDAPETPQQRALFWIEYVLRNSNRKQNYLRPSSLDLKWYQILLLDVAAFLLLCLIIVLYIVKTVTKCIMKMVIRPKSVVRKEKVQKKKTS